LNNTFIQVRSVLQDDVTHHPPIPIHVCGLDGNDFPETQIGCKLFGLGPEWLTFLWAIYFGQADLNRFPVSHHLNGVAIGNSDHLTGPWGDGSGCGYTYPCDNQHKGDDEPLGMFSGHIHRYHFKTLNL
jgi:hypothetical protein